MVRIIGDGHEVPPGKYAILEFYCTDDDSDCPQVYLHVFNDRTTDTEAFVSFGWEPLQFYQEWNHGLLDDIIRDFKGPALAFGFRQGGYAAQWLRLIRDLLERGRAYVARLEKHYWMMKGLSRA